MAKSKAGKFLKIAALIFICLLLAALTAVLLYQYLPAHPVNNGAGKFELKQFSSSDELSDVLGEYRNYYATTLDLDGVLSMYKGATSEFDSAPNSSENDTSAPSHSETNVQVEGVDEDDVIKTDGNYIYYLNDTGINILSAKDGATQKLSTIAANAGGMYLYGDILAVVGTEYDSNYAPKTTIAVYDVTDRAAPRLIRAVAMEGTTLTTRMNDGKIYYILSADSDTLPKAGDGSSFEEMPASNAYYFKGVPYNYFTTLGYVDLNCSDGSMDAYKSYLGAGNTFYMSTNYLYITATDYSARYYTNGFRTYADYSVAGQTRILKFSLDSLEPVAHANADGTVRDRYSLDEYEGNFRIATTVGSEGSAVFVFDENLNPLGEVRGIAPGEQIYSARFNGDIANIVTFLQVDPLFKVNLSDPKNITVSDGLKKDGVSYYLHYIEGTELLIGLGYDTYMGATKGIEVVLFDNSGADAVIINAYVIGTDSAYSESLYEPKGILYSKESDFFGFPATVYDHDNYSGLQKYYLFGFSTGKLQLRATLSHSPAMDSRYQYIGGEDLNIPQYDINRAVQIGDYIYAASSRLVTAHDINDAFNVTSITEI